MRLPAQRRSLTLGLMIGMPAALLAWLAIGHQQLTSGFNRVALGETQTEVLRTLGEPHGVVECGSFGGTPSADCDREFSYISALTFWDVWVVSFDASNRVIRKLRYRSP